MFRDKRASEKQILDAEGKPLKGVEDIRGTSLAPDSLLRLLIVLCSGHAGNRTKMYAQVEANR